MKLSTEEAQEKHRELITQLTAAYKQREDAQCKVNAAIRYLRASERLCTNLAEQLMMIDQLRLNLEGRAADVER